MEKVKLYFDGVSNTGTKMSEGESAKSNEVPRLTQGTPQWRSQTCPKGFTIYPKEKMEN